MMQRGRAKFNGLHNKWRGKVNFPKEGATFSDKWFASVVHNCRFRDGFDLHRLPLDADPHFAVLVAVAFDRQLLFRQGVLEHIVQVRSETVEVDGDVEVGGSRTESLNSLCCLFF